MSGNQSRGLILASQTKGWDPTTIPARDGIPARSITDFDVDMGNLPGKRVGELPDGRLVGYPDGSGPPGTPADPALMAKDWETPQPDGNEPHRRGGGDPYPGMPGAR